VIALVVGLRLVGAPRRAVRLSWLLLALIGVQGAVGYAQYFSGLPAGLVWVHVANSVVIWVTALLLLFALRDRGPVMASAQAEAGGTRAAQAADGSPAAAVPGAALPQDAGLR
jgi:heme A synthase